MPCNDHLCAVGVQYLPHAAELDEPRKCCFLITFYFDNIRQSFDNSLIRLKVRFWETFATVHRKCSNISDSSVIDLEGDGLNTSARGDKRTSLLYL